MCSDVRIAVVGTNFISDRFMDALSECDGVSAVAVLSRREETGRAFADKYAIPKIYCDLDALLADSDIDALYVASPTLCHEEQSCRAMLAGKHVLCEKMMSADLDGAIRMIEVSEKTGRVLLEAMRPAHDPVYDAVRAALPRLGKIRRATLEFCQYSSRYDAFLSGRVENAFNPKLKNSALADIGIYPLHAALMLFGEPETVRADSVFLSNGFEGFGMMELGYSDMIANITYSKISDSVNPSIIEGELGSLTVNKISAPTELVLHLRGAAPEVLDIAPFRNNMVCEIRAFRDMIRGQGDCRPYLATTLLAQRIVDQVYRTSHISDKF